MDYIDSVLTNAIITGTSKRHKLLSSIKAALVIGKHTLNRYYDRTDHSEVFRIAMGMFNFLALRLDMLIYLYSSTPSTQAAVFQERRMAPEVD